MLDAGLSHGGPGRRVYDLATTALILIGFQNDFFAPDSTLGPSLEDQEGLSRCLHSTVGLVRTLVDTPATIIAAPLAFTERYEELVDPIGILASIKAVSALRRGTVGADMVDELRSFGGRVKITPGRLGFNAFSRTELARVLEANGIRDVLLAGALDSVCIDATARAALERGYRVTVLSDCTVSRTSFEHEFFCNDIFPMYAEVIESTTLLDRAGAAERVM